jgi:hypothetical protein
VAAFFSEAQIVFFESSPYMFTELIAGYIDGSKKLVKMDKQSQKNQST